MRRRAQKRERRRCRHVERRDVRRFGFVLCAGLWGVAAWLWPGLDLGGDAGSLALQPGVLIAAASIAAAVVLFALAVGAVVLQVMAQYSWAVVRSVLSAWFAPALLGAVGGGIVLPLWVAFSPTAHLSTAAFTTFGWSILVIGDMVWVAARRISPPALSARIRGRALSTMSRDDRSAKASSDIAEVLGQLAAGAVLPYREGLRMVGSYTIVLAARSRGGVAPGEIAVAVRALGERASGTESAALAASIVRALWVLGLDQVDNVPVFEEARSALTAIASNARAQGQRPLAKVALDALADIATARIDRLLPQEGIATPARVWTAPPLIPRPDPDNPHLHFARPAPPSSASAVTAPQLAAAVTSRGERHTLLGRFVEDFAEEDGMSPRELAARLDSGLPRRPDHGGDGEAETTPQPSGSQGDAYDLLCETVEALASLLPAPQPSSTTWAAGWQGHRAFDEDVERLANLIHPLYQRGKHVPSDAVEEAVEQIGVRLRAEQPSATDLPPARTEWRYPPSRTQEGGIAATTANSLGMLTSSAFDAGFDRRALSTGLRLLASATASAKAGDVSATRAYANAVIAFTFASSRHGLEASFQAGSQRMQAVLIGMIAECDQLLAVTSETEEISRAIDEISTLLVWNAPSGREFTAAVAMLQTRLIATGWPLTLPTGHRLNGLDEAPSPPRPLPALLLRDTETIISHSLSCDEAQLPAAAVITLWAHAVCATGEGDPKEAQRIADFLAEKIRKHDERHREMPARRPALDEERTPGYVALDPQLRRLASAAIRWCTKADPKTTPTVPHASGPRTVQAIVRALSTNPGTEDWTYRGVIPHDRHGLVTVEMADRSRRVLRDEEMRLDGFGWGYTGNGPHALASVLLADLLAQHARCPDCLGTAPLAAKVIRCGACSGTGRRRGTMRAEGALLINGIAAMANSEPWERTRRNLLCTIINVRNGASL